MDANDYPRFSAAEIDSRIAAIDRAIDEAGAEHLVVYGANRVGSAVEWLSQWPVTREAILIHTPDERDRLLVGFYNHVPLATRLAIDADVDWVGPDPIGAAINELLRRGAANRPIAVLGPLSHPAHERIADLASRAIALGPAYTRLRLIKSEEEIARVRIAAKLTDAAVEALAAEARPGLDERELGNIVERAYVGRGGTTHIHYFGATPMDSPEVSVPAQWPSARKLQAGDALSCEISAAYWGYAAQLLRTFTIAAEPTPLYRELHEVAEAAFDAIVAKIRPGAKAQELVDASGVIEDAGFTTRDDLVHGFVGGYLPPVLGSRSRQLEPVPEFVLDAGMMLVVQPNVVTRDETAGVQTGELLLVTPDGCERPNAGSVASEHADIRTTNEESAANPSALLDRRSCRGDRRGPDARCPET
ncbi:aminopeptidase P family protein [Thermoleophilia bacterium SCSIO 60948]|nr:aminopeptidase P family protein [Thermoleophilia bacterium SCSIO 60948]